MMKKTWQVHVNVPKNQQERERAIECALLELEKNILPKKMKKILKILATKRQGGNLLTYSEWLLVAHLHYQVSE